MILKLYSLLFIMNKTRYYWPTSTLISSAPDYFHAEAVTSHSTLYLIHSVKISRPLLDSNTSFFACTLFLQLNAQNLCLDIKILTVSKEKKKKKANQKTWFIFLKLFFSVGRKNLFCSPWQSAFLWSFCFSVWHYKDFSLELTAN